MANLLDYKGLKSRNPHSTAQSGVAAPLGDPGGAAIANDLRALVDWHPQSNWSATSAPTEDDDETEQYYVGSLWLDTATSKLYLCVDNSEGAAVWTDVGTGEGGFALNNQDITGIRVASYYGEVDNGNSGTSKTIDWTDGNKQMLTLTGNVTLTFTDPPGPTNLILKLVQDGTGGRTVIWPASVLWPSGVAPTITAGADAIDVVTLYFDGSDYYGAVVQDFS